MLTFEPQNIPEMYALLKTAGQGDTLDALLRAVTGSESWKGTESEVAGATKREVFSSGRIPLFEPLKGVDIFLSSNGRDYSGSAYVYPTSKPLNETMEGIKAAIDEKYTRTASGLLYIADRTPMFVVQNNGVAVEIEFGTSGTARRRLNGCHQFEQDVRLFVKVLGDVVNAASPQTPNINYMVYVASNRK